jgi:CheY-like chemotaxis protein
MPSSYILMLEHDQDDQQLTLSILEELGIDMSLRFVANSDGLIAAIEESEPMLVLVDFNVKPETGLHILERIKSGTRWQHLPVVVLGETPDPSFVKRCYQQGACSYIIKPNSLEGTRRVIGGFFAYWLQVAETPGHRAALNAVGR